MKTKEYENVKIHREWKEALKEEFEKPYFIELMNSLKNEIKNLNVYPADKDIFRAFDLTPLSKVKVVILGQDPYHGKGQAHGLSFSVNKGIRIPPSLRNIYKELLSDLSISIPNHGDLSDWAKNGVLLLNAMLTVREASPGSHQKLGWQMFTDKVIQTISEKNKHCVFILWGNFARSKAHLINASKHMILESAHPSPFAAHRGFFGSKPFSKTNDYLTSNNKTPVDWKISG